MPILKLLTFLLAASLLPVPCLGAEPEAATILVVPKAESVAFWSQVRQGALDAGAERGVRILFRGPLLHESDKRQRTIIEHGLAEGAAAVVVAPSSATALTGVAAEARRRGVPLVVIDSALDGDEHLSFIATDNREAGRMAARFLLARVPEGGRILLLRHKKGSSSTGKREEGFARAVETAGTNDLLLSGFLGVSEGNAYHRTLSLLLVQHGIVGVFASGEPATMGCIRAIRELGLAGRMQVVGFDDTPEIRCALEDGVLQGVMVQQPYLMGRLGVETACDALAGKVVPKHIVTGARLVTSPDGFAPSAPVEP